MSGYQKDIRDLNDLISELNRAKSDLHDSSEIEHADALEVVISGLEDARRGLWKLQEDYHS